MVRYLFILLVFVVVGCDDNGVGSVPLESGKVTIQTSEGISFEKSSDGKGVLVYEGILELYKYQYQISNLPLILSSESSVRYIENVRVYIDGQFIGSVIDILEISEKPTKALFTEISNPLIGFVKPIKIYADIPDFSGQALVQLLTDIGDNNVYCLETKEKYSSPKSTGSIVEVSR